MLAWLSKLFRGSRAPENRDGAEGPKNGIPALPAPRCVTIEIWGPVTVVAFLPHSLGPGTPDEPESSQTQDRVNEAFAEAGGVCRQASGVVLLDFTQIANMGTTATAALCRLASSAARDGKEVTACSLPAVAQGVLDLLQADGGLRALRSFPNRLEAILTHLRHHSPPMSPEARESLVEKLFQTRWTCRECMAEFQLTQAMRRGPEGPIFVCPSCRAFLLTPCPAVLALLHGSTG